jgi:hypothetical protein
LARSSGRSQRVKLLRDLGYVCVGRSPEDSFFLTPVGAHEVQCYLQSIPSKKAAAAGGDEIPMFLAKRITPFVAFPLAAVANCSFSESDFPRQCIFLRFKAFCPLRSMVF